MQVFLVYGKYKSLKIKNMSATAEVQIRRMERSVSREGDDEIFVEIVVNDELGEYNHGKWLHPDEVEEIKGVCPEFLTCSKWTHFKQNKKVKDLMGLHMGRMKTHAKIRKQKEDAVTQPTAGVN